jgi:isoleucyl-tRNA synthetase
LEAQVRLFGSGEGLAFLEKHKDELPTLFIVSQVEVERAAPPPKAQPLGLGAHFPSGSLHAEVLGALGNKCPRCWTYSEAVGQGAEVCLKCADALR